MGGHKGKLSNYTTEFRNKVKTYCLFFKIGGTFKGSLTYFTAKPGT